MEKHKVKPLIIKAINISSLLLSMLKKHPLADRGRPKDIPRTAPDCGWNHGKPKDKKQ
jgi:hypothetical protein